MQHVLVIEDNPLDFEAVARALRSREAEVVVHHAINAQSALDAMSLDPSLIFLDLRLPGDDGRELIARIRADVGKRFIPIVVLSGSDDPRDIRQCYELGANSYCIKEFDQPIFSRMIVTVCDYWLTCVQLPR